LGYRGVYAHDRKALADREGKQIAFDDPERFGKAVHLADIHLEKGNASVRISTLARTIMETENLWRPRGTPLKLIASTARHHRCACDLVTRALPRL